MASNKRYALIGSVGAGKTTLFNALHGQSGLARKTQAVEFDSQGGVDTPGEFFNHPRLYNALINSISDVDLLIYVHAANDNECRMPAGLLSVYGNKPLATVITKADLAGVDMSAIKHMLRQHGLPEPIMAISTRRPESIQTVARWIESHSSHLTE